MVKACQSINCGRTLLHSCKHAEMYLHNTCYCVHSNAHVHAHTAVQTLMLLFVHSSSIMRTRLNPTHTDACTDSTHRPFLFSQLCSDIKQSPLRENKHADEERLAGHRGRQHSRTNTNTRADTLMHAQVLFKSEMTASDEQISKSYMA